MVTTTTYEKTITTHIISKDDRQPSIQTVGEPGVGGAAQSYVIKYPYGGSRDKHVRLDFVSLTRMGVTNEALLAIVIDRLEGFQAGEFANEFNKAALPYCRAALGTLKARTRDRMDRGVEGKAKE